MNNQKIFMVGAVALVFGVIGAVVGLKHKAAPPADAAAATAPGRPPGAVDALFAQSLNDAAGKAQAMSQWKGKPLVVNFWAPWCAPCVKEMPELSQLAVDSAASDIHVIGIGIDSPANIAQFAAKFKIAYPVYVAGMSGTDLSRQFGNSAGGLPYTVLIGADGKVRKTYLGQLKFAQLRADLAAL
ncbi:MAG: TlpA disulfide reductase family protein [Pseudomonadota bacterium]|nr:TlpA disulfide reductase family protein [Pseudomonadota bacterium]